MTMNINPERKGFNVVIPTSEEVSAIVSAWGDHKYPRVFEIIATNPAIQTHQVAYLASCNNVPDQVTLINSKLRSRGSDWVLMCTEPATVLSNSNGHHWYLVNAPVVAANDEEV